MRTFIKGNALWETWELWTEESMHTAFVSSQTRIIRVELRRKTRNSEIKLHFTCIRLILAICNHVTMFLQQLLLEVANSSSSSSNRTTIICTLMYNCTYPVNGADGVCIHIHCSHLVWLSHPPTCFMWHVLQIVLKEETVECLLFNTRSKSNGRLYSAGHKIPCSDTTTGSLQSTYKPSILS